MLKTKIITFVIIFNLTWMSLLGCANRATVNTHPSSDLGSIKSLYVLKHNNDDRGINLMIANRLKQMGYTANTGYEASSNVDAIITYDDRWWWDITMYMIELTVIVRDKETNFPLSTGNSLHTSLTRKSPQEMVDEVLTNLFSKAGKNSIENNKSTDK